MCPLTQSGERGLYEGRDKFDLESLEKFTKEGMHCGPDQTKTQTKVLSHSLVRSLVGSLIHLLRTTRFAHAPHCAHSFARLLTSLTPLLMGKRFFV